MRKPLPFEEAQIMAALVRHRYYVKGDVRGVRADLSFRNLSGLNLKAHQLTNVVLKGANLAGANLSECELTGADFFGADLEGADLSHAVLTGADFRGANLTRTTMSGCKLQGADFSVGGSDNARLTEAKLDHAMLCQANLNGCDMSGAELVDADLSGADLTRAVMIGVELSGAVLTDVKLSNTVLELSRLSSTQLDRIGPTDGIARRTYDSVPAPMARVALSKHSEWIESGGKSGRRLDFENVEILDFSFRGRNLAGARLRRCALNNTDFSNAILDMADLAYSDIQDANLLGASMRGANLRGANLTRSNMGGARFEPMILKGSTSWPANLDGAILRNADLSGTSFAGAVLQYADMRDCLMAGTNFIDVDLTKVKRSSLDPALVAAPNRRMATRFVEPKIFAKTPFGVFPSVNWSHSGVCLSFDGAERFALDSQIQAKIVAEGRPPPHDATLIVIRDDASRGLVMLKFAGMDEPLHAYLNSLVGVNTGFHAASPRSAGISELNSGAAGNKPYRLGSNIGLSGDGEGA